MLLSDEEIRKWWASENGLEDCQLSKLDDFHKATRAIEAAILAKLASAELPEPLSMGSSVAGVFLDVYLPVHLQQAHAQGFAAGAAAQLSSEPVGFIDKCGEIFAQVEQILSTDTPLYTRREVK